MPEQRRMWAYLPLPCDLPDVGDLSKWNVIGGDPLALLAEVEPFIGWSADVAELKERVRALLAPFEENDDA